MIVVKLIMNTIITSLASLGWLQPLIGN